MAGAERRFPMVVLLLDRVRRVSIAEAREIVAAELGGEAAATLRDISGASGMSYIAWKVGSIPYHLGTSSEPYLSISGEGKLDVQGRATDIRWRMREEVPPEGKDYCDAWMGHSAWLYVDALLFSSDPAHDHQHMQNVLRIANHFIDDRCVLLWLYGTEPKQVALPTSQAIAALRKGTWPEK